MKPKILIVGGGITGLALAALLEKQNIRVEIVEKSMDWSKLGYGITVMPAGLRIARKLQIIESLRAHGTSANDFHFLNLDGELIREVKLKTGGVDSITLSRNDLHASILAKLTKSRIRMNMTVTDIEETANGVRVQLSNGSKEDFNLVVGADGVRSKIREIIFPESVHEAAGAAIWTFFLPQGVKLPSSKSVLQVWDKNEFMGIFPFKSSAAVTFSAPLESGESLTHFDMKKHFGNISFLQEIY